MRDREGRVAEDIAEGRDPTPRQNRAARTRPTLSVVVVCMPERGHLQRLVPVIAALAGRGALVHVLTADAFAAEVTSAGGRFVDLFAGLPRDGADSESLPVASRYMSFAGVYLDAVTEMIAALRPGLIVYDTFALVAPLVAQRLGIPHMNVCAGHAAVPERVLAALRTNPGWPPPPPAGAPSSNCASAGRI